MRLSAGNARLISMIGIWGMSLTGFAKVNVSKSGVLTTYDVNLEGIETKQVTFAGTDFQKVFLKGAGSFAGVEYIEGEPELPVVRILVRGNPQIEIKDQGFESKMIGQLSKPMFPNQPSWNKSLRAAPPMTMNMNTYSSRSFISQQDFSIEDAGSVRGVPQKLVTLRPLSYEPATGQYVLRRHFVVKVNEVESTLNRSAAPLIAFVIGKNLAASPKIDELEQDKIKRGYKVERLIVGSDQLPNTPAAVRQALQTILRDESKNLRHAFIIGDVGDVASQTAKNISGLTDHYYRAIDTDNYDLDLNGPDIGVGRLSVNTLAQLEIVIDKILRYSQGEFGRDNWMNHPLFLTTHDRWQVAEGTHNAVIAKHFAPRGYDRVFPDAAEKGGDKLYPISLKATKQQIVSHMAAGRTIINYSGHGSNTGWEDVTTPDINSFADPDALPYVMSNACITGDFRKDPVFAETWLREPQGAITFWGSMDSTYWDEDDILEKALYDGMFEKGLREFDRLHQNALTGMWTYYGGANRSKYYWETYVTFGDPSLEFRTNRPEAAVVEGFDAVVMGSAETIVRIRGASGQPLENVNVILRNPSSGLQVRAVTSAAGEASLATGVFAEGGEGLELVAFASNIVTVTKSVPLISPSGPYFGFSKWNYNGRASSSAYVNEVIQLKSVVENFGSVASDAGQVQITEISGPAVVVGASAMVPAVGVRQKVDIANGLSIQVLPTANKGDMIHLTLAWSSPQGASGKFRISIPVYRAELTVTQVDYGSPEIEGISVSGDIYVTVKNTGNEVIRDASLVVVPDTCTTQARMAARVTVLNPGESIRIPEAINVVPDSSCESGSFGKVMLRGDYAGLAGRPGIQSSAGFLIGLIEIFSDSQHELNLSIPDKSTPVSKVINVAHTGRIKDVSVAVKIKHSYVGDLLISMTSPAGKRIVLRNKEGGGADDLDIRWGRNGVAVADLAQFVGDEVFGDWKIDVQDDATGDVGIWNDVELNIRHW
ncbi:MAG: C25 family cysteine peptidase [Proteobacteria bacterium]|nr:C25 family cysteine peptidase [Pseudomonadota bacterium]